MSLSESYQALSVLLDYPQDKEMLLRCFGGVASALDERALVQAAAPFGEFLRNSTLAELQEDFVATFDFSQTQAPYLGHHLYGEDQKKAAYMIMLKEQYAVHDYAPQGCELPDHICVLLAFLAHLDKENKDDCRRDIITKAVLPGLRKLASAARRHQSPWSPLIEAAELLMSDDCKEVSPC